MYLFNSFTSRCMVVEDSSMAGFPFEISFSTRAASLWPGIANDKAYYT